MRNARAEWFGILNRSDSLIPSTYSVKSGIPNLPMYSRHGGPSLSACRRKAVEELSEEVKGILGEGRDSSRMAAMQVVEFAEADRKWWYKGRFAEAEKVASRLASADTLAGNEDVVWQAVQLVEWIVELYDCDVFLGLENAESFSESLEYPIIEAHAAHDRRLCESLCKEIFRLLESDCRFMGVFDQIAATLNVTRDSLSERLEWENILYAMIAFAVFAGWGNAEIALRQELEFGPEVFRAAKGPDCCPCVYSIDLDSISRKCDRGIGVHISVALISLGVAPDVSECLIDRKGIGSSDRKLVTTLASDAFICLMGMAMDSQLSELSYTFFYCDLIQGPASDFDTESCLKLIEGLLAEEYERRFRCSC